MSFIKHLVELRTGKMILEKLKVPSLFFPNAIFVPFSIIITAYLAYGLFFVPAIFMDDWTSVFERVVTGNAQWLDLTFRNPLLFTPFLLQYRVFETNVTAYYIVLWSLYIIMAILLYKIVTRFPLPDSKWFGLIIALLFLVYPTDYTHMWLIKLGIYCGIVLTFLYGYFLLRFAEGASWPTLVLAITCLLISFGFYEGQLGVASAWAIILTIIYRHDPAKRLLSLISPIIFVGIFSLWRTLGFQTAGMNDQYLSRVVVTPGILLSRLLLGYKISLGWGWTYPVEQLLPWISGAKEAALLIVIVTVIFALIFYWIVTRRAQIDNQINLKSWSPVNRWVIIRPYLYSAFIGIVLTGAGYVPVLIVYLPSLSGIGSRNNIFATIGSALFFASVLMIGVLLFIKNWKLIRYQFLISAIPLVMLGVITQASIQYHNRVAWVEQKDIWRELFSIAPDIKDDTMVLFILPGYQDRAGYYNWKRTPLSASWEVSSGVRLLYNNATLSADVYFPDIDEPTEPILKPEGIHYVFVNGIPALREGRLTNARSGRILRHGI